MHGQYLLRAVEQELARLEEKAILKKVSHTSSAAPIVPVPKKDGKVRICGDYKVTVNPHLDVDQHQLPRPEELFATLANGKAFTKIDLSADAAGRELSPIPHNQHSYRIVPIYTATIWSGVSPSNFSEGNGYDSPGYRWGHLLYRRHSCGWNYRRTALGKAR